MSTGFLWHERYMWHDTRSAGLFLPAGGMLEPDEHAENPRTKRRLRNLLEVSGLLDRLTPLSPRPADESELLRFHTKAYIAKIRELSAAGGGDAGEFTPFGPGSYEIALLSAGGCIAAVDAVIGGRVGNAYALVRPPGHHAEAERGRGFCIFANVALAAAHARAVHGLERIAVVDWDVHHGNGTQAAFWTDPGVLTISIHQDRYYPPETGAVGEIGEGRGRGYNINVPLPPGSGSGAYRAAFERVVLPALRAYRPQLILVASGFDAGVTDPLGRMLLHSESYRQMARDLVNAAGELCAGRLLGCHEGGYSTAYVPFCGLAVLEELSGIATGVADPFLEFFQGMGYQELQSHQDAVIRAAQDNLRIALAKK
jgi:acetoin utilization deacetylase AcuC-like enzyme